MYQVLIPYRDSTGNLCQDGFPCRTLEIALALRLKYSDHNPVGAISIVYLDIVE